VWERARLELSNYLKGKASWFGAVIWIFGIGGRKEKARESTPYVVALDSFSCSSSSA
jgi:hypothetical protein